MGSGGGTSATVTVLLTDIEGSTRLWEEQRAAMGSALARHDAVLHEAIESHGGAVWKSGGDGLYAVFGIPGSALAAAAAARVALYPEILPVRRCCACYAGGGWLGSFEFFVGMLAMAMDRFELAIDHLERAGAVHRSFRSERLLTQSDFALGNSMLRVGRTAEGHELRDRSLASAERMGMVLDGGI